jgi:hypothetical protein
VRVGWKRLLTQLLKTREFQGIEILQKVLGSEHPDTATSLHNLAEAASSTSFHRSIICCMHTSGFQIIRRQKTPHRSRACRSNVPQLLLVTTLPILIQSMLRIKITLPILIQSMLRIKITLPILIQSMLRIKITLPILIIS